jgi:single-strand DNA-binding protein
MDAYVTVHGNVAADPVQRLTASGASVVGLRVAASGRKFDRASGDFRDGDPMFIGVSCWRSLGQNVMATLRKGDAVVVLGRLIQRTYDDRQGIRRSVHELDAIAVGPDLTRCSAELHRSARALPAGEGDESGPPSGAAVPNVARGSAAA